MSTSGTGGSEPSAGQPHASTSGSHTVKSDPFSNHLEARAQEQLQRLVDTARDEKLRAPSPAPVPAPIYDANGQANFAALEEEEDDNEIEVVNSDTGEAYGPRGKEPTRFGDWEVKGRCSDF